MKSTNSQVTYRSVNFEMVFWCLRFLTKNEWKQVDLRCHSSKIEFVCLFFGRIVGLKKSLRLCLTFSKLHEDCQFINLTQSYENYHSNHGKTWLIDNSKKLQQTKSRWCLKCAFCIRMIWNSVQLNISDHPKTAWTFRESLSLIVCTTKLAQF